MAEGLAAVAFLKAAIESGKSGAEALRGMREAGIGMRTQTGYRLIGEIRAALGNRETVGGLDYELSATRDQFTPWSAGQSGTFMYQVDVLVRNTEFDTVYRVPFSYVTDQMVSPGRAVDEATALYGEAATNYGETVHGGVLTGLYAMGQR